MTSRLRHTFWVVFAACPAFLSPLHAQPIPPAPPGITAKAPPPLPMVTSPVDLFRKLMAMNPADRDRELARRPPEIRKRILAKLDEYRAMKPDERDLRLRITELRWYVLSLIETPVAERAARLAQMPEAERPSLADRLQQWDRVPADEQREILKYEKTMEQFVDQSLDGHAAASNLLARVPPPPRPDAMQNLDNFFQLPLERRQQMYASFQQFFELTDAEKQAAVGALPETQRAQMAMLLRSLGGLPPAERAGMLKSLAKFSTMTTSERLDFIKNAQRWRELPPAERAAWRSLVNSVPPSPPLPPGILLPPMPPRSPLQASVPPGVN